MLRTSRCFRIKLSQFVGPRTLSAIAPSSYSFSSPSEKRFACGGQSSPSAACKSKAFLERFVVCGRPITGRGSGRRFPGRQIIFEDHESRRERKAGPETDY